MKLVIGVGNRSRGDDGAGLEVAARLRAAGRNAVEHDGDALRLLDLWSGSSDVAIVDAVVSGAEPGTVFDWDARDPGLDREVFPSTTHGFGVGEAVAIASALGKLPKRMRIIGIEAGRFDAGEGLTPAVAAAVERVARKLGG